MEIIWNGHSCFTVNTASGNVVLDPFEDGRVPGYGPLRLQADFVLCSHEHSDHNFRKGVALSGETCNVEVSKVASWHDEDCGRKRGANTIHILRAEDMTVVHLGDLGCDLNEEQIASLRNPDVLLIPIGGFYTIDSQQAIKIVSQLKPRITIPMHFRRGECGYDVLSTIDAFRASCVNPVDYPANRITVDRNTPEQTAFLYI